MRFTDVRGDSAAGSAPPAESVLSVLSVLRGARDVVARASLVPLEGASSDTLALVVEQAERLRSAAQAMLLNATAALEASQAGAGRSALRERARQSSRKAKRTTQVSEQIAQMPNVARGLAVGDLTVEHAEVLADAARQTSPNAVDTAADLLETAAAVPPEILRRDARDFAARYDPDAVRSMLARQRRERSAALFVDHASGMGVLNARLDPISFALIQQAVETYKDALWRQDGGRDGTPNQIRDNKQRLADAVFEMLTDRNALVTIDHPTAPSLLAQHHSPKSTDTDPGRDVAEPVRTGDPRHGRSETSDAERDRDGRDEHEHRCDSDDIPQRCDATPPSHRDATPPTHRDATPPTHRDATPPARSDATPPTHSDTVPVGAAGRSIQHWRPAQAPNQLVIVAEMGVIDGTTPHGRCEALGVGPVPAEILNNLSPDTRISGAVFDTAGQPLWLGRGRRLATAAQQLAVAIRDRGCVLCRAPMHRCEYHHIDEWNADRGTTDPPNLAALCDDCHNGLHERNQRLRRHPTTGHWDTEPRSEPASGERGGNPP
ncbi:HNH endonuclease [Candidatus Poriferisodalis sp.]|uniref:HNH endonuclease n=1 Tax=Candidatus Poriferisodalis sp. TaxID=3101277 RepID=UPI003B51E4F8